ncbi:MAG: VOC family protein [Candidatus Obscuribacterales bacterium]|nr:VOC family protein [Candidatus Obscuribacterales bacterium]
MKLAEDLKFNHLGVAVFDLDEAIELYKNLLGYRIIRGPIEDPLQKVSACFVGRNEPGHPVIELVAPTSKDSPIGAYLKRCIGAYHTCYEVPDLGQALQQSRALNCKLIGEPVPAVAFDGRKICWLYTPTHMLIELLEAAR